MFTRTKFQTKQTKDKPKPEENKPRTKIKANRLENETKNSIKSPILVRRFWVFHLSFIFGDECGFGEHRYPSPTRGEP